MKIAIYFSGRIKAYEYCIEHLLKLKEKYNLTIFCSLNIPELSEYEKEFFNMFEITEAQYIYSDVIAEPWINELDKKGLCVISENMYSHFFNNNRAFELIEAYQLKNNVNFDCIIKYRADIFSNEILNINYISPNTIYIPYENDHTGINDQIDYGDFCTMKYYSNVFNNIIYYCKIHNTACHPETLTLKNLEFNNINIVRFNYNYILHPARN
jgi:hypothetical protein